jgi:multiple sugar transport system permease protein
MSIALSPLGRASMLHLRARRRRAWTKAAGITLGIGLLIWTLLPIYNMVLIALDSDADEFTGSIFPPDPDFSSFRSVWTEDYWLLEHFWHQFGNSIYLGVATMLLTVALGSLTSFALGRMRLRNGWIVTDFALLTYVLPTTFLVIPFVHIMHKYGMVDSLWSVVAAMVAFATPYAILIFHQYGKLIPMELDESAKIDGASPWQIYLRIYLPLMAPALVAVGVYAMLLAWNEYIYQFLLLSSTRNTTVAVMIDQFFDSDEAPWNYMMAIAIIYSIPPIAIYFGLRRFMVAGLTFGGVKG